MAEGLKRKNQSFLPIPSGAIDPSQGCDPLLLIHANQMPPICGADWSTTPLNSGSSQSEVPITGFTSPLGFFFFKNIMTADFLPALPLLSQGRLSDGFLISTKAEAACFHTVTLFRDLQDCYSQHFPPPTSWGMGERGVG